MKQKKTDKGMHSKNSFLIVTVLVAVVGSIALVSSRAATNPAFVQTNGNKLQYGGQDVLLKGVNFDNVPALGARIGTGKVADANNTEEDYQKLNAYGANHVRYGLSFNWYDDNKSEFFSAIDQQIAWAKDNNIWLSMVMFTTPGNCYEGYGNSCAIWNSASEQRRLSDFWIDVSARYKNEPTVIGYDILNEPTPPESSTNYLVTPAESNTWCNGWWKIAESITTRINDEAPNQLVFIGACSDSYFWRTFNGDNIVYEVHDYSPLPFSHAKKGTSVSYPGLAKSWDGKTYLYNKTNFAGGEPIVSIRDNYAINWAESKNVPIYIGEWGTTAAYDGYVQFMQDKATLYNQWGINHAVYGWRHNTVQGSATENIWGVFDFRGDLTLRDNAKLNTMKTSWQGAIKPNFTDSPLLGIEAEGGVIDAPAQPVRDESASNNEYILFGR